MGHTTHPYVILLCSGIVRGIGYNQLIRSWPLGGCCAATTGRHTVPTQRSNVDWRRLVQEAQILGRCTLLLVELQTNEKVMRMMMI